MSTHKHPNQAPAHPNLQHTLKHRCDKNPAFHVATPPHTTIFSNKTAPLLHVSQDSCTIATQSPAAPSLPDTTHSRTQNTPFHGPFKNHPILWTPLFETPLVHETRHFHGQTHQDPPFIHETGGFHGQLQQNPPPLHETRHFHGQIPGPRLHRHKAGRAAPG